MSDNLEALDSQVVECARCPRLVAWREKVAEEKRAAFEDWDYWGRPVPGFGDPDPWMLVVGLAPAAHGANRTGRMFTGDRSGDWLYGALHRAGFANQPEATDRGDGLRLRGTYVTATVRCAPPANRPTPSERGNCREYLEREIDLFMEGLRVIVPLGGYAYHHVMRIFRGRSWAVPSPMPDFGHGLELELAPGRRTRKAWSKRGEGGEGDEEGKAEEAEERSSLTLLCSYHPSQQNTFTGTLTEEMFARIWERARELEPS